jgi:hypothetical protein
MKKFVIMNETGLFLDTKGDWVKTGNLWETTSRTSAGTKAKRVDGRFIERSKNN